MNNENPKVVFVAGAGRSGSTLLERVLARLPGVQPLGEVLHMWQRGILENQLCGCGQGFLQCQFWTDVGHEAFGGWDRVDVERVLELKQRWDRMRKVPHLLLAKQGGRLDVEVREYAEFYARLYAAAARVSGASVVIDSSKQPSLPAALARHRDLDLLVLHLVRDSRGVTYSWTKRVQRPEIADSSVDMARYHPLVTAMKWDLHNLAGAVAKRSRWPVSTLRYEDLVSDPSGTIAALASNLDVGVPHHLAAELRKGEVTLRVDHTAAGNPMRFRTGTVLLRSDEKWQTLMPKMSRGMVTMCTMPGLRQYGYLGGR